MYRLDFGSDSAVSSEAAANGEVTLRVVGRGAGKHRLVVRADNLTVEACVQIMQREG